MKSPLNIHSSDEIIELSIGIYAVSILGGWSVVVNDFSISLRNAATNTIVEPKSTRLRVQSYAFKKRAKKIFSIDISEGGKYIIEFKNPTSLKVRRSNLFISPLYRKLIPNENLEIYIG